MFGIYKRATEVRLKEPAYSSGTLQAGSDSAVYQAGGWKLWLPLVMRGVTP